MAAAKDIILRPIPPSVANALVRRLHYSGKVVNNSQIHIGVYLNGKLEGAMQFGPSLDKRKLIGLVEGTLWNEFIELNRMAFSEALPRNSESRALSVAMRILRKHAPHLKWVVSFADGTQCGDGTIYRAAGFVLTAVLRNKHIFNVGGEILVGKVAWDRGWVKNWATGRKDAERVAAVTGKPVSMLEGWQLRYLYFLDPTARERLTCPILPFSEIERRGAGMYKGKPRERSADSGTAAPAEGGGANPTRSLHNASKAERIESDGAAK